MRAANRAVLVKACAARRSTSQGLRGLQALAKREYPVFQPPGEAKPSLRQSQSSPARSRLAQPLIPPAVCLQALAKREPLIFQPPGKAKLSLWQSRSSLARSRLACSLQFLLQCFLFGFGCDLGHRGQWGKCLVAGKVAGKWVKCLVPVNQEEEIKAPPDSQDMEYRKVKDEDRDEDGSGNDIESKSTLGGGATVENSKWKRKSIVTLALTFLTSSQAILIVWSKRAGKYEYSVTTANFMVETLKCGLSLLALGRIWRSEGVTEDNRLTTTLDEVIVYPIPALLYLVKNLLQYYIFAYVDAPGYQILKNLNIISTGVLYRIILKKKLSEIQWAAFILLCAGCTTAQLNSNSDHVLQTPVQGWVMAIVMALLSGFAGVYTEAIIKKCPSRNINVQNFWLYVFGMIFNAVAIVTQDFDAVMNK
uniref:CMP-sialic acid transporter 4 n=1 Tax=Fagus sylvatica TaxID=28930 RepID=A0A2N9HN62_FAGSY